jgi:hypothetical protein
MQYCFTLELSKHLIKLPPASSLLLAIEFERSENIGQFSCLFGLLIIKKLLNAFRLSESLA